MRSAFPVFLSGLMVFFLACRHSSDDSRQSPETGDRSSANGQRTAPLSLVHFTLAEQKLAIGDYGFAAQQLHKGIIAYRTETGKMHGNAATEVNRAIDKLILLRKSLREGKPVDVADLHLAIQLALAIEAPPHRLPEEEPATDKKDLFVPVSGH